MVFGLLYISLLLADYIVINLSKRWTVVVIQICLSCCILCVLTWEAISTFKSCLVCFINNFGLYSAQLNQGAQCAPGQSVYTWQHGKLCSLLKAMVVLQLQYLLTSLLSEVEEAEYALQLPVVSFVWGWLVLIGINTANSVNLLTVVALQSLSRPAGCYFCVLKKEEPEYIHSTSLSP